MKPLLYPDGEPCCVGDLVWFNEGLCVGRVEDILPPERMRAERESSWNGGRVLSINYGLGGQAWGAPYCHDESMLADEGIAKLSSTEQLAVELMFLLLGRQLKQRIWENPEWNYVAWLEAIPPDEQHPEYDWGWNLAIAPQSHLEQVQSFRYDAAARRFLRPGERGAPVPPRKPQRHVRSLTTTSGETYHEGDLVWEHGRLGVTSTRIRRIVRPEDEEAAWLLQGEKLLEPWVETTDLERENGGRVQSASSFEQECCGKITPTEKLGIELLFHLLRQHPAYPETGTILRCGLSVKPMPVNPGLRCNWRYERARRRLSLFVCSERDPLLGTFICYRFRRKLYDFMLEPGIN